MPEVNGIWQYEESDAASTWSEMLNKLGDSVRNRTNGLSSGIAEALNLVDDLGITQGMAHYFWIDNVDRDAQTGMKEGDLGDTVSDGTTYRYNGANWRVWDRPRTTYVPSISNLTLGNGSIVGWYAVASGRVFMDVLITFGSGTAVTGDLSVSLPIARDTTVHPNGNCLGEGIMRDASASASVVCSGVAITNNIAMRPHRVTGSNVQADAASASVPFSWATSDYISFQASYWIQQ